MNIYQQQILEHYHQPHNFGVPAAFSAMAEAENASCGDEVTVYLSIADGRITHMQHVTNGCAICVASASLLSDELKGKEIPEVLQLNKEAVEEILGIKLTPARQRCGLLPLEAVKIALKDSNSQQN